MEYIDSHRGFEIRRYYEVPETYDGTIAFAQYVAERGRLVLHANTEAEAKEEADRLVDRHPTDEGEAQGVVPEEGLLHRPAELRGVNVLN